MHIDEKLIEYLEELSCLTLDADEKKQISGDLEKILSRMRRLSELDLKDKPSLSHPFDAVNGFRNDLVKSSMMRSLVLKNAPKKNDEFFIAPKTV